MAHNREYRNEKVQNLSEFNSNGNKGIEYSEFIFLLTNDLIFLFISELTTSPKGKESQDAYFAPAGSQN